MLEVHVSFSGATLINIKTDNDGKKILHNLKVQNKKFLQSPKAKKNFLQDKIAHPPLKNIMVHP